MEPKVKVVFREANGFQYLVSYMSKLDRSLLAVRTPEWTLGKSECAISGIMVWIYVGGLYWPGRDYVGIEEILLGVVYTCIQCHPLNMLQSFIAIFGQSPILT